MVEPKTLEKDAKQAEKKADKPLPALVSPLTRLSPSIRKATALYCKEQDKSFSIISELMWFDLLKKNGKIAKELQPEERKAAASGLRVQLSESEDRCAELEAKLAALKAGKK